MREVPGPHLEHAHAFTHKEEEEEGKEEEGEKAEDVEEDVEEDPTFCRTYILRLYW